MIKTRLTEIWKKLTGYHNHDDTDVLKEKIDSISKELKTAIQEFQEHKAIEKPSIITESLKHDIDALNTKINGITTRIDQLDTRNNQPESDEILSEKELHDLQFMSKETSEYHKLKAKANRIYEKTGFVPPGFMIDANKKLRRSLNMKGKSKGKPDSCNQLEENKKPVTILREFAYKGREKPEIGILDTPN